MRIYFDTCSLNRPLDNRAQLRVALEAEAILGILANCEVGRIELVSSEVLIFEAEQNPHPQKKAYVQAILEQSPLVIELNDQIETRAMVLERQGFHGFDALHIASAEFSKADFFCTCDDRILIRAKQQSDLTVKVVSPLELAQELSI